MNVWYTPERLALYQEIDQRRMARYERREREAKRREHVDMFVIAVKATIGMVMGVVGLYALMLLATI